MSSSSTFNAADGHCYELLMGRWSRRLADSFVDFAGVSDRERVLDVGCGTGSLTFVLAKRPGVRSICGIDHSAAYIDHAKRLSSDPRIEFRAGDACSLPFPDATFDRVLALLVLHFVAQPERAVAEMCRVARPGATLAAAVWDARGGFVANRMFWDAAALLDPGGNARRARSYTRPMTRPGELAAAWRGAGMADVVDTSLSIRMEFASFDDYWTPYTAKDGPVAEYVATLDEPARARLRDAVRLAYLDGEPDGARSYAAIAWAVKGVIPS
jgi:SAM-dependent methyltransferase